MKSKYAAHNINSLRYLAAEAHHVSEIKSDGRIEAGCSELPVPKVHHSFRQVKTNYSAVRTAPGKVAKELSGAGAEIDHGSFVRQKGADCECIEVVDGGKCATVSTLVVEGFNVLRIFHDG
ncbi:MAG: hypothetical protein ABSH28_23625 [Acidobacteriota bacterium]